jgi:alpha-tubulin suppressor-like RCC1 family protein
MQGGKEVTRKVFLVLLALVLAFSVGLVACTEPGEEEEEETYDLNITSSAGGSVTIPGEPGPFPYSSGTMVNLVATPDPDHYFVEWTGDVGTIADVDDPTTTIAMNGDYSITANFAEYTFLIAAGSHHTVGLEDGGTVLAVGWDSAGQCNVGGWTDIVQVAAGWEHTVGLENSGTVVAVGDNTYGQCDVTGWTNIVQVAAGGFHTVGLRADGTVVAAGNCTDITAWTNIVQVDADWYNTVGLKSDGTVVVAGSAGNTSGMYGVGGWTDIIQVAAGGGMYNLGLRYDGTVVAAMTQGVYQDIGQCNVTGWTDIIQIDARGLGTFGLSSNGNVVVATRCDQIGDDDYGQCDVTGWTDIIQVAPGLGHTVGLKSDGTVVAVGANFHGQVSDVASWDLIP